MVCAANGYPILTNNAQEHLRLKFSKYLRTSTLSPKVRRSYIKKETYRALHGDIMKNNLA